MVAATCLSDPTRHYSKQPTANRRKEEETQARLEKYNQLVLEHQDAVFRQALWILGDEDAAADAAQETFLRAYRYLDRFNGGPFRPWVLKIATNYCLDQLRRWKRHATVSMEAHYENGEEIEVPSWLADPGLPVEKQVEVSELQARVQQAINRLPQNYRTAVILVDIQAMDYQEAASALGIHLGTFKSRLCRARSQLQKWLEADRRAFLS